MDQSVEYQYEFSFSDTPVNKWLHLRDFGFAE